MSDERSGDRREPRHSLVDSVFRRFLRRKPRQSRSHAIVEALVQALDHLLVQGKGLKDVSVERVSERAGVGVGTFYEYFGSKESLLGALVGRVTRENFEVLARALDEADHETIEELTANFAKIVWSTYLEHPERFRVLLYGIGRLNLVSVVTDERDRFAEVMAAAGRRYFPDVASAELTKTMRMAADAVMGVMASEATRSRTDGPRLRAEDVAGVAIAIIRARHPARDVTA